MAGGSCAWSAGRSNWSNSVSSCCSQPHAQLPPATWAPLAALEEGSLVDRGGILNFAHDFFRAAVGSAFAAHAARRADLRLRLADHFEAQPITVRTCDELPWLLEGNRIPRPPPRLPAGH